MLLLLNPRRTRTNMKLLQLVWIFLLTLCGQSDYSYCVRSFAGWNFLKITEATTSDSGTHIYHATFPPELRSTISLPFDPILKPRPEIGGASPKPSVIILRQTKKWALLQCEVLGAFPKPEVVWTSSEGATLDAYEPEVTKTEGNKFDTVLNIIVTKTDNYTCVATQKEIYHQINRTTFVHFSGAVPKPYVTILGETNNGMRLQCEVFVASPKLKVSWKNSAGHVIPAKEQKTEKRGGYDIILETTVTKTDYYRCVTTEGKKDDELHSEIFVRPWDPRSSVSRLVPAAVVGVLGLVAAVVV